MSDISRRLEKIRRQIALGIGRGIIKLINDTLDIQEGQITGLDGEIRETENFAHFGFTSRPPKGTEAVFLSLGGVRSNCVIIATEHRQYRLELERDGDAAIYSDLGDKVLLCADGIKLESSTKVEITAPNAQINAPLHVTGEITCDQDIKATGISLKNHKHSGVQNGGAKTGAPE